MLTKKPMNASLPPTPCHRELRENMIASATRLEISLAEAQRRAFALFLSQHDTNSITKSAKTEQAS
jgi:hypothetical protein